MGRALAAHLDSRVEEEMDQAERLLDTAAHCYLLSEDLTDPVARLRLMEMARLLRQMAYHAGPTRHAAQDTVFPHAPLPIQ